MVSATSHSTAEEQPRHKPHTDSGYLTEVSRYQQSQSNPCRSNEPAPEIRCECRRHAHYRMRHNSNGNSFQPHEEAITHWTAEVDGTKCEQHQKESRGEGEGCPGGKGSKSSASEKAQSKARLRRRRARQELAQRNQLSVVVIADPLAALHKLSAEIAQVGDWPAKRS